MLYQLTKTSAGKAPTGSLLSSSLLENDNQTFLSVLLVIIESDSAKNNPHKHTNIKFCMHLIILITVEQHSVYVRRWFQEISVRNVAASDKEQLASIPFEGY